MRWHCRGSVSGLLPSPTWPPPTRSWRRRTTGGSGCACSSSHWVPRLPLISFSSAIYPCCCRAATGRTFSVFELLASGLAHVMHVKYLVPLFFGTLAGVFGGALPGVTITMTIIVVLPFTFGLDPLQGLAAMTGVYVGGSAGGPGTPPLLRPPGTPPPRATTVARPPPARQGETGRGRLLGG